MTSTTNLTVRAVREFEAISAWYIRFGMECGPGLYARHRKCEEDWVEGPSFMRSAFKWWKLREALRGRW